MSYQFYHVIHLISVLLLVGVTFACFAAPTAENRKRFLAFSGIASLAVLVSGFGLVARLQSGFPFWVLVKVVVWLFLSAVAGLAFKKAGLRSKLFIGVLIGIALAVYMVSLKPTI